MNKTVAVIAADGRAGQAFVDAALHAGMKVRAGYHGVDILPKGGNMTTYQCDATNKEQVRQLLTGSDVVVSLIGHVKNSPATVQTDAMKTIKEVMDELGIKRIISLTGTGVRFPGDSLSWMDRILNVAIKIIDPKRINDGVEHAAFLGSTNLDWTIVRVLKLTNGRHSGMVTFSLDGPAELFTPRARVAAGIVQIITEDSYSKKAPIIQGYRV